MNDVLVFKNPVTSDRIYPVDTSYACRFNEDCHRHSCSRKSGCSHGWIVAILDICDNSAAVRLINSF